MNAVSYIAKKVMPWRYMVFLILLGGGLAALIPVSGWSKGMLLAFDGAAAFFLVSLVPLFRDDARQMRKVAAENDTNRIVLLVISFLLTVIILAAIVVELSGDNLTLANKSIIATSLALVWTFGNAVYMLHYCHLFYSPDESKKDRGGLVFPDCKEPLMSDFAYFAFTLGVAVQTSDVQITSNHLRKVVTAHCVVGFFFNLGVLALTINVLGTS